MIPQKPTVAQLMISAQVVSIIGMSSHSSIICCLVMQGGRAHKWPRTSLLSQPSVKTTSTPPPLPPLFSLFISSVLLFCSYSSMDGLCGSLAKVEQALYSAVCAVYSARLKGKRGSADGKGNNAPLMQCM